MPNKSLSVNTILEKNKLSSKVSFIVLLEIQVMNPDTQTIVDTIFVANNNENIVFNSETYLAFAFDISLKEEAGTMPDITITARDFQKVILTKLNQYSGASGSIIILRVVNTDNLAQGAEIEQTYELMESSANSFSVSLKLGVENSLRKVFPRRTQMRDRCAWRYKSPECGYSGGLATCDLTLQGPNGCATHNNTINYGGFPGLTSRGHIG
jgi:phage-related protein